MYLSVASSVEITTYTKKESEENKEMCQIDKTTACQKLIYDYKKTRERKRSQWLMNAQVEISETRFDINVTISIEWQIDRQEQKFFFF
jgi:hypothetical protein